MHQTKQPYSKITLAAVAFVKDLIDKDPLSKISTDELANLAGISRNLLQKVYRKTYGLRIKDYRLEKRLEASCDMLLDGRLSIKQVSMKCGYKDQYSFSHAFKRKFNMGPKDWQNSQGSSN